MDEKSAKRKLDHVIDISRVEMYKPIQIAEVLRRSRMGEVQNLGDRESYRIASRRWRDDVTTRLFSKVSTSNSKYQDDVWNDHAVPPSAMVQLGLSNSASGIVEAYIYAKVAEKSKGLTEARATIESISPRSHLTDLLSMFESEGFTNSADRIFEIVATALMQVEVAKSNSLVRVIADEVTDKTSVAWTLVERASRRDRPLNIDRLGRTNAADAGLDIWTNFGIVISVKRRPLSADLLSQVLRETPVGDLHIVCREIEPDALPRLKALASAGREVSTTTEEQLRSSWSKLVSEEITCEILRATLINLFDHEFPLALTLNRFLDERGYAVTRLTSIWAT